MIVKSKINKIRKKSFIFNIIRLMGNSKSQALKEEYVQEHFKVLDSTENDDMGNFEILCFDKFNKDTFLRKLINPSEYDQYADINEFVKNLSKTNQYLCDFYFVEYNKNLAEMFDLIFECGKPIKRNNFQPETIWALMEQIIEVMEFLELNKMHYPHIKRQFIFGYPDGQFKIMNPYCFKTYLKEVL